MCVLNLLKYIPPEKKENFDLTFGDEIKANIFRKTVQTDVNSDIEINLENAKKHLHASINGDVVIRTFVCRFKNFSKKAFVISVDGLSSGTTINEFILKPFMEINDLCSDKDNINDIRFFVENMFPQGQVSFETDAAKVFDSVNFGNAALFIDGCKNAAIADVKSWEHRSISAPVSEEVIQGPHEAFNEMLRCNTALIRKTLNTSDLILENLSFGSSSKTPAALAYVDGIANPKLVKEIKKKLHNINEKYIMSVFDIEKILEEKNMLFMPQIVTTERPDKVCRALLEGRVALVLNGSSHVLILPSNISDIVASPEDSYLRKPYSVFIKFIRIIAMVLSLLTPGVYIALTTYHQDTILTNMFLTILSESSKIPFVPLTEIVIMEIAFELIKEAAIRVPGAIGSSLGIVGGLILGQTAVNAGLVSPIVIILVSVCGISSFAIPSYSLSFSFRIMRFIYIFAGAICGIIGIVSLLTIQMSFVVSTKTFGVPFCVPFSPKTSKHPFLHAIFDTHSIVHPPRFMRASSLKEDE